jgi:transposase
MQITTVGLDLAKRIFQVHAVDASGSVVVRKALRRSQVLPFFTKLPSCLIGMEACGTSHYWARELTELGHEVRLMPPSYVKPYVKRGKNDAVDAEAICEAVTRPTMRFVAMKSAEQQAALSLHRTRSLLVKQRTQLVNMIRGLLAEFGIDIPEGLERALGLARQIATKETRPEVPARRYSIGRIRCRSGTVPLGARVCRLARPDTFTKLERRQGSARPHHQDGRPVSEKAPGGRRDIVDPSGEIQTGDSRSSASRVACPQTSARGERGHGEQDGPGCLGGHDARRDLSSSPCPKPGGVRSSRRQFLRAENSSSRSNGSMRVVRATRCDGETGQAGNRDNPSNVRGVIA